MDAEGTNPARRIEILFADVDRRVVVDLADGHPDGAAAEMADRLVSALGTDDPDEAERELAATAGDHATVRRLR